MFLDILLLVGGFVFLTRGAEWLVRGGGRLSRRMGVSSIIVGLTVVSYGTSFPEFLVCSISAARGQTDLALGNVIGSNICNIGLVLGVAALLRPIIVDYLTVRRDIPFLIIATTVLCLLCLDGEVGRIEGGLLVIGSISYTGWHVVMARRQHRAASSLPDFKERAAREGHPARNLIFLLLGGLCLWAGSEAVVRGAVSLARTFDLDMRFVGLTVVALGTSLPELAATTVASVRGETGIGLGNVIGSNICNILFVLGFAALIRPVPVELDINIGVDMGVMLFLTMLLWPLLRFRRAINRTSGAVLLALYLGYIAYRAWLVFGG